MKTIITLFFIAVIFSFSLSAKAYAGECNNLAKKALFYGRLTNKLFDKIGDMTPKPKDNILALESIVNVMREKATQKLNAAEVCYAKKYANGDKIKNSYAPLEKAIVYFKNNDVPFETFKLNLN
jgi:hypothetical protein